MDKTNQKSYMNVVGGFYSIIHFIIIVVRNTIKLFSMNKLLSYVTIRLVVLLVLFSAYSMASGALEESPNMSFYSRLFYSCDQIDQPVKENKIVLRVDDIQAFAWRDIQIRMIEDAINRDMPLVLGVIPFGIDDDKELYNFLRNNSCNLEIAQHGWTHGAEYGGAIAEFGNLSEEEAYKKIILGKPILEKIAGQDLTTFIPPNNKFSTGTALALEKAGFSAISAAENSDFGYSASTYDSEAQALNPLEDVMSYCTQDLEENKLCIIMLHPQDYASDNVLDEQKYKEYLYLLDSLLQLDAMFVKISDLVDGGNLINNPDYVRQEEKDEYKTEINYILPALSPESSSTSVINEKTFNYTPTSANSTSYSF